MTWLDGRHGFPRPVGGGDIVTNTTGSFGVFEEVIKHVNESGIVVPSVPYNLKDLFTLVGMAAGLFLVFLLIYALVVGKFFFIEKPIRFIAPFDKKDVPTYSIVREYYYTGLRRIIRELYLSFLARLHSIGVMLKPGYTPREVARAAKTLIGDFGYKVARLYEELMYSRKQPTTRDVEEFKKVVSRDEH
ncbi:DUF4129 domain-containing protein [Desulfurococcaceae archaeon MEX13E-LK6-19]|nr:DUF4129 domain-containing protein [Desulfurococcaceae archaeon MEX13E-LK6-19]